MDPVFLNSQEVVVDAKQRMGIPERFLRPLKKISPDHPREVGVSVTPDRSIKVMPYEYFAKELESWRTLDTRLSNQRAFLNLSASYADRLNLDKQNRIKLSPSICKFCSIERNVIMVGSMDYFQVFDIEVWNQFVLNGMKTFGGAADAVAQKDNEPRPVQIVLPQTQEPEEK